MIDRQVFMQSLPLLKEALLHAVEEADVVMHQSEIHNPWFIRRFQSDAIDAVIENFLNPDLCQAWLNRYPVAKSQGKQIGLIMAGNIPLVGFHDLFCVLAAGQQALIKLSDKDQYWLPFLLKQWSDQLPELSESYRIVDKLDRIDAVIATGSNNSGRYFDYYFKAYPHLFRQNRNGVAVLHGDETPEQLKALAKDIFTYFGLGCRNVSKLYVPAGYDFSKWAEVIADWSFMGDHNKYRNNLDYNYAIYLINRVPHLHLGHLILKEDDAIVSRIACLHYSYYPDREQVAAELDHRKAEIQCVVSEKPIGRWEHVGFGQSQHPRLDQYADGVDTMEFLVNL